MLLVRTELRPSPIHGLGVFTSNKIPKGTPVWEFTPGFDLEIPLATIQSLPEPQRKQMLQYAYRKPGTDLYVLCGDDTRFFNHSSSPSVISTSIDGADVAAKDLEPGEELTIDYFTFDEDAVKKLGGS